MSIIQELTCTVNLSAVNPLGKASVYVQGLPDHLTLNDVAAVPHHHLAPWAEITTQEQPPLQGMDEESLQDENYSLLFSTRITLSPMVAGLDLVRIYHQLRQLPRLDLETQSLPDQSPHLRPLKRAKSGSEADLQATTPFKCDRDFLKPHQPTLPRDPGDAAIHHHLEGPYDSLALLRSSGSTNNLHKEPLAPWEWVPQMAPSEDAL